MNLLDRTIAFFSPQWAVSRVAARATLQQIESFTNGKGGYDAGKLNLNTKGRLGSEAKEHAIPQEEIARLRWQSWKLWRNNPYAKKIVRSIQSKVIGRGVVPESLATNIDGTPHVEFRERAKQLWKSIQSGFDNRGLPGRGGQTLSGLQKLSLKAVVLSGDVLLRLMPIDAAEQVARDIPIPVVMQVIDINRLANDHSPTTGTIPEGHSVYRGIEIDSEGKRVAYWINSYSPGSATPNYGKAVRIPAEQIIHLYVEDDIDQYLGVPWFAAALLQTRDTGDLQYNVLKASAMAACVVMGYRKPTGAQRFGLNASETSSTSADGTDLTDDNGNAITKIQPGMFINLGKDGELQGFSPNQGSLNAESFIQHMLRGTAAAFPGVKGTTLTGDYRNSTFSSERSADNDTWPEVEDVQDWFASSFCQPIYEAVIRAGILSGYFDGIVTADEFAAEPSRFNCANWQGPIPRSVNPIDDVNAAGQKMKFGLSSLQKECAAQNINWLEVLNNIAELYEQAKAKGIPEEVINNILGVSSQDVIAQTLAGGGQIPPGEGEPTDTSTDQSGDQTGDSEGDPPPKPAKSSPAKVQKSKQPEQKTEVDA